MAAQVQAVRAELLKIKGQVELIQAEYKENAEQRIEYQNKMSRLNEMIQQRCKNDTMLIEDVIVASLVAETAAQKRFAKVPEKPPPTKAALAQGTTKSAQEALKIYNGQIEVLKEELKYRTALSMAEKDMDIIFRQAVDDILDIMDDHCSDTRVHREVETYAAGGIAPSSPRKSRHKQNMVTRLLTAPSSPVKNIFQKSTRETNESPTASADTSTQKQLNVYHESPKVAFNTMTDTAKKNNLLQMMTAPNLMDDDDNSNGDDDDKDAVDFGHHETKNDGGDDDDGGAKDDEDNHGDDAQPGEVDQEDQAEPSAEVAPAKGPRKKKKKKKSQEESEDNEGENAGEATTTSEQEEEGEPAPTPAKKKKKKKPAKPDEPAEEAAAEDDAAPADDEPPANEDGGEAPKKKKKKKKPEEQQEGGGGDQEANLEEAKSGKPKKKKKKPPAPPSGEEEEPVDAPPPEDAPAAAKKKKKKPKPPASSSDDGAAAAPEKTVKKKKKVKKEAPKES